MPNWCQNEITITNFTPEFLAMIEKVVEEGKENFFQTFCPLETTDDNWYDLRNEKWGCKWDTGIYASSIHSDLIHLSFDSANCPPIEFYEFLVASHGCSIDASFKEAGNDIAGRWIDGEGIQIDFSDAKQYCELFETDEHPLYSEEAELRQNNQLFFNGQFIGVLLNQYEWLPVGQSEISSCVKNESYVGIFGNDLDDLGIDY